jgi:hypothetical protein
MQCKPVAALPVGDTWTFGSNLMDIGIAVKRARQVTLFSRHRRCSLGIGVVGAGKGQILEVLLLDSKTTLFQL